MARGIWPGTVEGMRAGLLLSVCNSPRTGGFTMAPGASIDDGLLDMVFAPQVSKGRSSPFCSS